MYIQFYIWLHESASFYSKTIMLVKILPEASETILTLTLLKGKWNQTLERAEKPAVELRYCLGPLSLSTAVISASFCQSTQFLNLFFFKVGNMIINTPFTSCFAPTSEEISPTGSSWKSPEEQLWLVWFDHIPTLLVLHGFDRKHGGLWLAAPHKQCGWDK